MEGIQSSFFQAENAAALEVIKKVYEDCRDIELIGALSDLLDVSNIHPTVIDEAMQLTTTLLEICKEEADPQLISATANLIKSFSG